MKSTKLLPYVFERFILGAFLSALLVLYIGTKAKACETHSRTNLPSTNSVFIN